jgi:hypothetical protein
VSQYFVENSHLAAIEPRVYELVQYEFNKRKQPLTTKPVAVAFRVKTYVVNAEVFMLAGCGTAQVNTAG